MTVDVLSRIGRRALTMYRVLGRVAIAVRLWNTSLRLNSLEKRRRTLDADSRRIILHRMELERRDATLSGQSLIPLRGSAPILVRSMGRSVAR